VNSKSLILFLTVWLAWICNATAQNVTARAGVSSQSIFVGEPIQFQIQVSGSETPDQPDLSALTDFHVKSTGGGSNSSRSISIINGRRSENVQLGYVFNYELRARREGRLTIPAVAVIADGQTTHTQAIVLNAQKPSETENFKLRLNLSKEQAYVGEQIVLEAIFYFRGNVDDTQLSIPIIEHPDFKVYDLEDNQTANKTEILDGQQFQTSRVRKVLVPLNPGKFPLEPATLSFRGQDGFQIGRDFFGRRVKQAKFKNFVIPSNTFDLEIRPLPTVGQPVNFAGHVGDYSLNVQASPTEVNVGDPITLNIAITGPALLDPVKLPALNKQENLTRDFKIPGEIEDGTINGSFKTFTQTVRALRDDITSIPSIELSYFDTSTGQYQVAKSSPIPIKVRATRILTAGDAEGLSPVVGAGQEVQSWMQGIAHNYSGADILENQPLGFSGLLSPSRLFLIVGPPLAYAALLGFLIFKRQKTANPEKSRARRALTNFNRNLAKAGNIEELLTLFRTFLGDKLSLSPSATTYRDVENRLREKNVDGSALETVNRLFTAGEASRFSGGNSNDSVDELRAQAADLAKQLDKKLR